MLSRSIDSARSRKISDRILRMGVIFVILGLSFHFWRYRSANVPVRHRFEIDQEYETALASNDESAFLRILRDDYLRNDMYPPGFRGRFALCGTDEVSELSGFDRWITWLKSIRIGALGNYLQIWSAQAQHRASWPVKFWREVCRSSDDDHQALYDHPGLALAAIDELERAAEKYAARYPLVATISINGKKRTRLNDSSIAPEEIADSLRIRIYQRQLRIGESVDLMVHEIVESASFGPMREIVAYALKGEPDSFMKRPWVQDEVTDRFVRNDSNDPFAIRAHGLSLWRKGQYQAAERELRRASGLFENDPLGRFAWANCMQILGMDFEPADAMGTIARDHPHFRTQEAKRLALLSSLYEQLGQRESSIVAAESAVRLNSFERGAWTILARAKKRDGDLAGAKLAEDRIAAIDAARAKLEDASAAALQVIDEESFRIGSAGSFGEPSIVWPEPAEMKPLADKWIDAAEAFEWKGAAAFWKILREHRNDDETLDRLERLAETPEFREDAFFFPRPELQAGEPSTMLRVQRWIYGL